MSEYKIVGADGNEYGPVDQNTIRGWFNDNRLNAQSRISKDGGEFKTATAFPEFSDLTGGGGLRLQSGSASGESSRGSAPAAGSPASVFGSQAVPGTGAETGALVQDLFDSFARAAGWAKFAGVILIIGGVINVLSISGILIAWAFIWQGVLLLQAASASREAAMNGDFARAKECLEKLKTFIILTGVVALLGIVLIVAVMVFFFAAMAAGISEAGASGF